MYPTDIETYRATLFDRQGPSPVDPPVIIRPNGILLHSGEGTVQSDMFELTGKDPHHPVSVGNYTTRTGLRYELGPDYYRYWHAGAPDHGQTSWHGSYPGAFGITDGNKLLGMEAEHKSGQNWPDAQLESIAEWAVMKIEQYNFSLTHVGAHKWYAPSRKTDPTDFPDTALMDYIRSFFKPRGFAVKITNPLGARIRQAPRINTPIAGLLDVGYVFWCDGVLAGDTVQGPDGPTKDWYHFAGPTPEIRNPLGFVSAAICERET
jgi:hypothetical protein